ncbi:hypothetical protein HMPREF1486_03470 [Streptomyces sp. HPH0547]|nr:hypothetical protein HMPREF1486_03470 [Streptomyces sp. HPH0547]
MPAPTRWAGGLIAPSCRKTSSQVHLARCSRALSVSSGEFTNWVSRPCRAHAIRSACLGLESGTAAKRSLPAISVITTPAPPRSGSARSATSPQRPSMASASRTALRPPRARVVGRASAKGPAGRARTQMSTPSHCHCQVSPSVDDTCCPAGRPMSLGSSASSAARVSGDCQKTSISRGRPCSARVSAARRCRASWASRTPGTRPAPERGSREGVLLRETRVRSGTRVSRGRSPSSTQASRSARSRGISPGPTSCGPIDGW